MERIPLKKYFVTNNTSSKAKEEVSVYGIRQYFNNRKEDEDSISKYDTLNSILDFYSVLRKKAEEEEKNYSFSRVINLRKEIPLELEKVYEMLDDLNTGEPPIRLISKIAEEHFNDIVSIAENMRKVLVRDRQLIPIDKIQQIDNSCIRWLTKQPGSNTAERAGNKQKLMGVVRLESMNTLENRVFKSFLKHCISNGNAYLKEYKDYPAHNRVKAVKKLVVFAGKILKEKVFEKIGNLLTMPVPNYVLLQNHSYNLIWEWYKEFVKKSQIIEIMWKNKEKVFKEFFNLLVIASINHNLVTNRVFKHNIWIAPSPNDEGLHLYDTVWDYMDCSREKVVSYTYNHNAAKLSLCQWKNMQVFLPREYSISFYYIEESKDKMTIDASGYDGVVYIENKNVEFTVLEDEMENIIKVFSSESFLKEMFEGVNEYVKGFI